MQPSYSIYIDEDYEETKNMETWGESDFDAEKEYENDGDSEKESSEHIEEAENNDWDKTQEEYLLE